MLLALQAWLVGLLRAVTGVKCVVVLYVASLLTSAVVTVPVFELAQDTLGSSPAAGALLRRHDPEFAADWFRKNDATVDATRSAAVVGAVIYSLTILFLSGGILAALADRRRPLTFTTFFASCGRYLWPFARGLAPGAICLGAVWVVNGGATGVVNWLLVDLRDRASSAGFMFWAMTAKTLFMFGVLSLAVTLPMQFARIRCVVDDDRRMLSNHVAALKLCFRRPLTVLTFTVLAIVPWFGVLAAHDALLRDFDFSGTWSPLGIAVPASWIYVALAQLCVFAMQGLLVLRAAGLVYIHQELCPPPPARDPELLYAAAPVVDAPRPKRRASEETTAYAWLFAPLLAGALGALTVSRDASAEEPVPVLPTGPFANEYVMDVRLDTDAATITGTALVTFRNFSAAPVTELPFHLYPNAWSNTDTPWIKDARKQKEVTKRGAEDGAYLQIASVKDADGKDLSAGVKFEGTILRVKPAAPVPPGGETKVEIGFTTKMPRTVRRMGHLGEHYDVMQWFPKLCAHRDGKFVDWIFRDPSEFCSDFGKYQVKITLPDHLELEATGVPIAETKDEEKEEKSVTFAASAVHDFAWIADPHFIRHETKSSHGAQIVLMNQPFLEPKAQLILDAVKRTMENYGEWYFPYPYPRVVIDAVPAGGQGGGMEYPMLFTIGSDVPEGLDRIASKSVDPTGVTIHEFTHQYWYGIVANDEFSEAWLDEGFTTYMTFKASEAFFGKREGGRGLPLLVAERVHESSLTGGGLLAPFVGFDSSVFGDTPRLFGFDYPSLDRPGMPSDRFYGRKASYAPFADVSPLRNRSWEVMRTGATMNAYRSIAYSKPCLVLRTLERQVGEDAMRAMLRTWTRRFAFRHPTSDDFVKVADEAFGGKWHDFLVACIDGSESVDWAVEEARTFEVTEPLGFQPQQHVGEAPRPKFDRDEDRPRMNGASVTIRNRGRLRVPTEVELTFDDGKTERRAVDGALPWTTIEVEPRAAKLVSAVVDPDRKIALDLDVTNNGRLTSADRDAALPYSAEWQFWVQSFLSAVAWFS